MIIPWTPKDGPLCYLATPYSKYRPSIEAAFIDASKLAAKLMLAGVKVYSPIAHTHPLAVYGKIDPLDHAIWLPFDEAMMNVAQILIVARMDGWDVSRGIAHEVEFFARQGKPIFDLCPKSLIMTRRPDPRMMTEAELLRGHQPLLAHNKTPSEQGGASA